MIRLEFDTATNQDVRFPPFNRTFRGRFVWARDHSPSPEMFTRTPHNWPAEIPGQQLAIDEKTKTVKVVDPIFDADQKQLRNCIKRASMSIDHLKPSEELVCDWPTLVHWCKRLLAAGQARLVEGKLPEKVEGTPRMQFIRPTDEPGPDKLKAALLMLADTPEKRAAVESLLATA